VLKRAKVAVFKLYPPLGVLRGDQILELYALDRTMALLIVQQKSGSTAHGLLT